MGKIFCVMGKSSSGKDTIYNQLLENKALSLNRIIPYTTRPIRDGEKDGETYFFCDEATVEKLDAEGKIVELREYNTVYGIWKYFTVDDGQIDLESRDYLLIGTLETFVKVVKYFGKEKVLPIYIEVEDGDRLIRAISREKQQQQPKYEEMCRRFLADAADFSEENIKAAGINKRFENINLETTIQEIEEYIKSNLA